MWKIILNSSYGFWGLRTKDRDSIKFFPKGEAPVKQFLEDGKFKSEANVGDYTILRVEDDIDVKDFNVGIASAISSYARCLIWNLINDIELKKGGKVFMCDTDSVICSLDITKHEDLMKKYMWDGTGEQL